MEYPTGGYPHIPPAHEDDAPTFVQRVIRLFTAPRRALVPPLSHSVWAVPLVLLLVVVGAQSVLLSDLTQERMRSVIENNDRIPEEQRDAILEQFEEGARSPGQAARQAFGGAVSALVIAHLVPALLYLLGLNFVLGAGTRFREVFAVTLFSGLVYIPRELLRLPIMLSSGTLDVYTGPAALAVGGHPALVYGLNLLDVFELYRLFVLAVGFAAVTGLPAKRTAYPVLVVWLLYGLVGVGCALSPLGEFMR